MLVDRRTLSDLAIFDAGEDGVSALSLVSRTRTRLGNIRLRARMRALPASDGELAAMQEAVRYAATNLESLRTCLDSLNADAVDEYLTLRWQAVTRRTLTGRFLERLQLRTQYRDAVRQITLGVGKLGLLLGALPELVPLIASGPEVFAGHARRLKGLEDHPGLRRLRDLARGRSLASQLEADRLARGSERDTLAEILGVVADVDAVFSLGAATMEHGWVFPVLEPAKGLVFLHGLRHPALSTAVANTLSLEGGQRVLAVTGPNMAGKSTLLKAAGMAVYLAHLGSGVPAVAARVSRFDALLASLYVRDSLSTGESFYLSEVRRIKDLMALLESTPGVFAIIDEPFKGTNVHDASEATGLLLDGLCAQSASAVIVATHLASVVRSRIHDACLATAFLGASDGDQELRFDYQLRDGVSEQRLGMILLQREGVARALTSAIARRAAGPVPS